MRRYILILTSLLALAACQSLPAEDKTDSPVLSFEECIHAKGTTTEGTENRGRVCRYGQMVFWEEEGSFTVDSFEECVAAGNPVMESYPRQCRYGNITFVEPIDLPQNPGDQKSCPRDYRPVCGQVDLQCITTPCEPLKTTFVNECEAKNAGVTNITEGACVDEGVNPEGACLSFDGLWIEETQECEGMARQQCEALGGTFNECASACRNDLDAEFCTEQCVLVCEF